MWASGTPIFGSESSVASIIGPFVGALLFERFGTWTAGFYGCAVLALLATGFIFALRSSTASARAPMAVPAVAK